MIATISEAAQPLLLRSGSKGFGISESLVRGVELSGVPGRPPQPVDDVLRLLDTKRGPFNRGYESADLLCSAPVSRHLPKVLPSSSS